MLGDRVVFGLSGLGRYCGQVSLRVYELKGSQDGKRAAMATTGDDVCNGNDNDDNDDVYGDDEYDCFAW